MDPAVIGGLIGLSVMGCLALTTVCYEKGVIWKEKIQKRWSSYRRLHVPLLSSVTPNPLLVRSGSGSGSKHFQMKELLASK